jgi:hypothetical protein
MQKGLKLWECICPKVWHQPTALQNATKRWHCIYPNHRHQPANSKDAIQWWQHIWQKDGHKPAILQDALSQKTITSTFIPYKHYLLTPCSRVFLEKLTSLQLVKKFAAFYGTRRFITTFTSARHLSLSWASSIQSITTHPTSRIAIVTLFSIYSWVSPLTSFLRRPHEQPLYALHALPISFFSIFVTRKILGEEYNELKHS